MTINLDDYRADLGATHPEIWDAAQRSFIEAARVMSPAGLQNYIEGARALEQLGRGKEVVISYLEGIPAVTKEVGEDLIKDTVAAALKLTSMVSGEVVSLLFANLPTAARRLGDAQLMRGYLALIHQLSAKAPRGLRPMLNHLDELFAKLTLGGLRRWALWGAQAHARDFEAQFKYFNLTSSDSQAVLQRERRGTLFVDTHRKLNLYLRALWAKDFFLRPTSGDFESREGFKPYIEQRVIHLPDAYDDYAGLAGKELYRAAAAHAAAHLIYMRQPLCAQALTPAQMFFIAHIEDARIEHCAIAEFPGLRQLWLQFHHRMSQVSYSTDRVVKLLELLGLALLDESVTDVDPSVQSTVTAFRQRIARDGLSPQLSWDIGMALYHEVSQRFTVPSLRLLETIAIPYRDDNRYLWAFDEQAWHEAEYVPASQRQTRRRVSLMDMIDEVDCEFAGDDAQEIWTLESEYFRDGDPEGVSINQIEGKDPVSVPYHYAEWDYQVQLHRPDWTTVLERRQPKGDPTDIDQILIDHKPIVSRIRRIVDALQPQGVMRQHHCEDGDEIDLNAAIRAMVDIRLGITPNPRINTRLVHKRRDLAVLLLLDLSESTNDKLPNSGKPVIQLAREATTLVSSAINGIGDPFALHGFASDGRHDVQYYRFKDFDQAYDDEVKSRLAGMRGGLSTRMGAALRHAATFLLRQPQQKKLLLLISDGEPADIDVRDPQYLRHDTKKATEELASRGITTYCLTLDTDADDYVARVFGVNRYSIVDHVNKLPERLPALFMELTR